MKFSRQAALFLTATSTVGAFAPASIARGSNRCTMLLRATTSSTNGEINSMRASAIKQELESYGISTKAFLEKKELVAALEKARADGMEPIKSKQSAPRPPTASDTPSDTASSSSSVGQNSEDKRPREERIKEEMEKLSSMKAAEMKRELQDRGVSTKSFFEKSEFMKALAEARVDNISASKAAPASDEEGYAEYTNVEVLTDENSGPRKKKSAEQASSQPSPFGGGGGSPFGGAGGNPFGAAGGGPFGGAGSNPFAGAGGNPFGGAGGMGGIADMLKNMGGMGGMGGNPFGGTGGGMGDMMGKAQEMMKNPKIQEIMAKAQANPRIMAKMTECMSNPAAIAKYQNDPEVAELIKELQKNM